MSQNKRGIWNFQDLNLPTISGWGDKQGNKSGILQVLNKCGRSCWNNWYNITLYDTISKESLKYVSHTVHSKLVLLVLYFPLICIRMYSLIPFFSFWNWNCRFYIDSALMIERFSMNPDLEFRKRGILIRAREFENKKTKITRQEERVWGT